MHQISDIALLHWRTYVGVREKIGRLKDKHLADFLAASKLFERLYQGSSPTPTPTRNLFAFARDPHTIGFNHFEDESAGKIEPRLKNFPLNLWKESHVLRSVQMYEHWLFIIRNALCDPRFLVSFEGFMGGLLLLDVIETLLNQAQKEQGIVGVIHQPQQGVMSFSGGVHGLQDWYAHTQFGRNANNLRDDDIEAVNLVVNEIAKKELKAEAERFNANPATNREKHTWFYKLPQ